jgi:hypothetical protein
MPSQMNEKSFLISFRKVFFISLSLGLLINVSTAVAFASIKPGTSCKKAGQTSTINGIKYTCVKSGKKLVWNKGVALKAFPKPSVAPTPIPSVAPAPAKFEPWGTNIDSKMLSDEAQKNFLAWVKTRTGAPKNHTQLIQENPYASRISILKKADDLGAQIFSSFITKGSLTVIGADESWTLEQLAKSGWPRTNCNDPYLSGVVLCIDGDRRQGYVVTRDYSYDEFNPGRDGAALLAHEYFHLVQSNLAGPENGLRIKSTDADSVNAFPAWFIEGSAGFVGFSVGALSHDASYWNGRPAMFTYSPPDPSTDRNPISDYEIRTCCGNNTPTYPYVIGQVATEYIVASIGFQKFLDIFVDYKTTKNFEKSFASVTGISKEVFYEKFDLIRTKVGLPAISWKLDGLINKKIGG